MASLYRKWRPGRFSDVVGQPHVVQTLQRALASGDCGHAYLFCGPRGSGKTTVARLVAKALNCQSPNSEGGACDNCATCLEIDRGSFLDIIEIDAASNRGIDEIRELREKVRFKPTTGAKKVFIIDEVHMLTKEAFNALLKTLEEPPEHVVFVLATTEPHKIPATIISRTQRFDFRPAGRTELANHIAKIANEEGIKLSVDGSEFLADAGQGSYRDAISLLEQVSSMGVDEVDRSKLEEILGLSSVDSLLAILESWSKSDKVQVVAMLEAMEDKGRDLTHSGRELLRLADRMLVAKVNPKAAFPDLSHEQCEKLAQNADRVSLDALLKLIQELTIQFPLIKSSPISRLPITLALLQTLPPSRTVAERIVEKPIETPTQEKKSANIETVVSTVVVPVDDESFRATFLDKVKPLNHSVFAMLKSARLGRDGSRCLIAVDFAFHKEQLAKKAVRQILDEVATACGCSSIEIVVEKAVRKSVVTPEDELLIAAQEVFNG